MTNKEIRKSVEELLKSNDLYKIPVDIVKLAQKLGFTILQQEIDYDGAILVNKNKFNIDGNDYQKVIIVNINQMFTRKRFTIAHEIAHWKMAPAENRDVLYAHRDDNLSLINHEPDINNYASELLMPYGLVANYLNKVDLRYGVAPSLIKFVADTFNVSYSAAQVRIDKFTRGL